MSKARKLGAVDVVRDVPRLRAMLAEAPEARRLRPIGLGGTVLDEGVLHQVGELAAGLHSGDGKIAVLMDHRPMAAPDGETKEIVVESVARAGGGVRTVLVGGSDARVHADTATLETALQGVKGSSVLVTVGSGTVSDIGKFVSARLNGLPHIIVQTAASVNGFGDDQSVLVVNGVKRTTPTRWADRLVIDTGVLALAPTEMNRAGLGDLLATYTAPADWLLARLVRQDDSFSPAVVAIARDHVDSALEAAPGVAVGSKSAMEPLAAALTLSGISMGVAGRTAPGSGMEHTVSHLLEMTERGEQTLHGAQVGALTVLAALLWQRVRNAAREGALNDLRFPGPQEMKRRVSGAFDRVDPSGAMAAECWHDYERKLARWIDNRPVVQTLEKHWAAFDDDLDRLLAPPARLVAALHSADAPTRLSELGIEPNRVRWALANCHLMRDRFTVADLAFFLGLWNDQDVDALIDEAATLGGGL